ncbi:ATP-binding protein [Seohaeicola saemankumensis]|uniref:ATP-binding protein n=1 Tax=Seohaeicola TaxID=481178 RepID=UPI0035D06362
MSKTARLMLFRYAAALVPAVALIAIAFLIGIRQDESERLKHVADHARLAAASLDLRLGQLLEITTFCASAPALIERVDLDSVAENCGRYASQIGAWVVIVETGETHRQILNTRVDAPAVLPSYPRKNEHATLLALEASSKASGEPGIADVFTGIIYPNGIISAGQYLRLADSRSVMLYVSLPARTLSDQLAGIAADRGPIFGLIDPSRRVVARSVGIDRMMFADAPEWIIGLMEKGASGASLGVPGPEILGGTWDAGYHPLSTAPGWMAGAFQPSPIGARSWTLASIPSAVILLGLMLSGLLLWVITNQDKAARRVQEARQAGAESERQNREKSRLLAAMAHDIRSPLVSLIGSLEMIAEDRGEAVDQISAARGSAEALLQFVDDILELSFLGSGKLNLHPSPVDLRQLASSLYDQTRGLAERKGLELRLELDPDLPVAVEVDRLRLQQVLSNLLTNAVKYTEKGFVTLRFRQMHAQKGQVTLALSVVDSGIGLKPDQIPRILREFGRLEREAERREQGVGLGLAIVQRILHSMGAVLEVESAAGEGSNFGFHLTLPVATGGDVADAAKPLADVVILYAEDEPVIRKVTARRLEEAGAKVTSAVDGEDALSQLATMTPDLLLIDLQMPQLDGAGLIRRLGEITPDRDYPIFVLTSHISGPQAAEARAVGADAVFTKPVQVAALAAAFRARHGNGGRSTRHNSQTVEGVDVTLLDRKTFLDAAETMGASAAPAMVDDFEMAMREDLISLKAAMEKADREQVSALAHRCQGLCLVMGASSLAQQLRQVEDVAPDAELAAMRLLARNIDACLDATIQEMRSDVEAK